MSDSWKCMTEEAFKLESIQCPNQPGNLRISKQACGRRYRLAHKRNIKIPQDEFGISVKSSLAICRTCSEGRIYSEMLNKKAYVHLRE